VNCHKKNWRGRKKKHSTLEGL